MNKMKRSFIRNKSRSSELLVRHKGRTGNQVAHCLNNDGNVHKGDLLTNEVKAKSIFYTVG